MGRPGLLELTVYAVVLAGTASWVYGLTPFTPQPGSSHRAEVQPASPSPSSGPNDPTEQAESKASDSTSTTIAEPSQQDTTTRETASREPASDSETQPSQAASSEPEEQPRLDPQANLLMVTATRLNMRSEPNANSALVGSYPRGALVEELTTSGNWVLVRTVEDESMGWMWAGYLGSVSEN